MKTILFACFVLLCSSTYAQRFQSSIGTGLHEDKWAVIEDPTLNRFVTIGNSVNADNVNRLWIASYTQAGTMVTSAVSTNGRALIARDICLAPSDPNNSSFPTTYYVTGWTLSPNGISQMFVGRVNLSGAFLWYRESSSSASAPSAAEEGVAITLASNGDAVAAGHTNMPPSTTGTPGGMRVKLARFTSAGAPVWSNVYNNENNWKVREIANGTAAPNCAPSPTATPGEFIITGEVTVKNATGANVTRTFAALYNGAGAECWRNIYPASSSGTNFISDAGYDVVLRQSGNYVIAGVAQMTTSRASMGSTPYFVEVNASGTLVNAAVYLNPDSIPLGIYPRCIAKGQTGDYLVCAGPDFEHNNTFFMRLTAIGNLALIRRYPGVATANSATQPFWLDDAQPEGILYAANGTAPGYVISTNAVPGPFGGGDGHLIRTDVVGKTPLNCESAEIANVNKRTGSQTAVSSIPVQFSWVPGQMGNNSLGVQQIFCRDVCSVSSAFTYTQSGGTVTFSNGSSGSGTLSYLWTFGDGATSTSANPSHSYAPGTYSACLTVKNLTASGDSCKETVCKTIVAGCSVTANFKDSIYCRYTVSFTNTSVGAGTYKWIFDDTITTTGTNPKIKFSRCGRHTVKLIACNRVCCDTIVKVIEIPCCTVKSDFCLVDSGRYVTLLYSKDINGPGTTYTVYLDGTAISWGNGTKKLLSAGPHTICMKASRVTCEVDTCCATCCKTINVTDPCRLIADYWYQVQSGGSVVFTNKTTPNGYSSVWNFGDGSPTSTTASPSHVYQPGTYMACLTTTVVSANGTDTCRSRACRKIIVEAPCKIYANFMTKYCLQSPLSVDFINLSSGAASYSWSFGDGTTSNDGSPRHTYTTPGSYIVCLTAAQGDNCWYRVCYRVIVSTSSCDTSCAKLPAAPVYGHDGAREIPMVLESAESSENGAVKDRTAEQLQGRKPSESSARVDKLTLFPNPASQKVQVNFETTKDASAEVTVINALGGVVYKKSVSFQDGKNSFAIPIQELASGNYFLRINTGDNIRTTMFAVKK